MADKTYTQEEMDKVIADMKADAEKKSNASAAAARLEATKELEKSKMTADEKAKAEVKETMDKLQAENLALTKDKHMAIIKSAVSENGLPSFLAHDERLVSAKDEEIPEVIKTITKEAGEFVKPKIPNTAPTTQTQSVAVSGAKDAFGRPINVDQGVLK